MIDFLRTRAESQLSGTLGGQKGDRKHGVQALC